MKLRLSLSSFYSLSFPVVSYFTLSRRLPVWGAVQQGSNFFPQSRGGFSKQNPAARVSLDQHPFLWLKEAIVLQLCDSSKYSEPSNHLLQSQVLGFDL
ncbi:hypothetical protein RRG08_033924 [Elysia crispata]|uniref:Uncharacterized protein n=1 Tax=Elysia crispata TaxID=231223 RepID=A0AAE1BAB6_9GAST|nr:hypothetical protein RRG08_033924 [Elysia crispata]